jgi:hypothetical protein
MGARLQVRSLLPDPKQIIVIGTGARTGMYLPQTPNWINMGGGSTQPRNPRSLEINGVPTLINQEDFADAPPLVKNQVADLVDRSLAEVIDDPGGANTVLTGDQVRAL